jgi:uncharacterized small protein (DUF1192 family)
MSTEDKELRIKALLAQIPQSSSFASVSLTKEIAELSAEIERERMEAEKKESPQKNTS